MQTRLAIEKAIRVNVWEDDETDDKIILSDMEKAIQKRIDDHLELIDQENKTIKENFYLPNIVLQAAIRINERYAKIGELREFLEHSFGITDFLKKD